jgi:hypothetical protein
MDKHETDAAIAAAAAVSGQLSEEGVAKQVYEAAIALTKGQFANSVQDKNAAALVLAEAYAMALAENTSRPTCCQMCQLSWLGGALNTVVQMFEIFVRKNNAG